MSTHIKIVAIFTAHPERAEALEALLVGMRPRCRAEPGNLRWDVWQDRSQPGRFVVDELYEDEAAVDAHRATPHYLHYRATIEDLAVREAIVLVPTDVAS